jgi:hypothetical protein
MNCSIIAAAELAGATSTASCTWVPSCTRHALTGTNRQPSLNAQVLDVIKWNGKLQMGASNKPPPTAPHGNHTYVPLLVPNTWFWGNKSYNDTWDTVIVNGETGSLQLHRAWSHAVSTHPLVQLRRRQLHCSA